MCDCSVGGVGVLCPDCGATIHVVDSFRIGAIVACCCGSMVRYAGPNQPAVSINSEVMVGSQDAWPAWHCAKVKLGELTDSAALEANLRLARTLSRRSQRD